MRAIVRVRAFVLGPRDRREVDPLEHELAQREHRAADLLALDDVAGAAELSTRSCTSVSIRLRAARAEHLELVARQVGLLEDPVADRVVDVVVDVGDAVDDAHDLPSCVSGSASPVCVRIPSTTSCVRLSRSRDARRLLVVAEAVRPSRKRVERRLAGVTERRMAHVVPEPDRLGQILVQPSARATTRAIPVVSSVCVIRVR